MGEEITRFINLLVSYRQHELAAQQGQVSFFAIVLDTISHYEIGVVLSFINNVYLTWLPLSNLLVFCLACIVLWKITPLFAEWISAPDNILFKSGALDKLSSIVELGCGISPLNALALLPHVSRYVLTDQPYVHKLIQQNLEENNAAVSSASSSRRPAKLRKGGVSKSSSSLSSSSASAQTAEIRFETLDWETDEVSASLTGDTDAISFDAVIACDCVFNYALVQPFVQTCVDVCRLREAEEDAVVSSGDSAVDGRRRPCLCIIAQQLRNDDVFRSWLSAFMESFHVWRMPEEMLPAQLRPGAGFVVHVGILRDSVHSDSSR